MAELVSIIVPVYNVEKYLDRCIESIVNQTYTDLEILLIDDGSPDNSPQMCDEWARRDSRIRVIHKENQGLGMARNTGIDEAGGKYICFFDSDDYVDTDLIANAHELMTRERADITVFSMSRIGRNGNLISKSIPESKKDCYRDEEVVEEFLPCLIQMHPSEPAVRNISFSACSCMFSMDLIRKNRWRFVSEREIISEDLYSLLQLYKDVKSVAVLRQAGYYYCDNGTSLTHTYRPDRFEKNKHFYEMLVQLCVSCGYPEKIILGCMGSFLGNTVGLLKQEMFVTDSFGRKYDRIKRIIGDELLQRILQEKRNDHPVRSIRILFYAMRHKRYLLCCGLLLAGQAKSILRSKNSG